MGYSMRTFMKGEAGRQPPDSLVLMVIFGLLAAVAVPHLMKKGVGAAVSILIVFAVFGAALVVLRILIIRIDKKFKEEVKT